ncbi:MAG: nuclear transport factor 2 family protein [Acidobacteriota bacterium]
MLKERKAGRDALLLSVLAFALIALGVTPAIADAGASKSLVEWDAEASEELEHAYHMLHDSWNKLDVAALQNMLIGDDVLATFDMDPDTHQPIKLNSKADMDDFTSRVISGFKAENIKVNAKHPMIKCRASNGIGICTEECTIHLSMPNGESAVELLRASAVAVKHVDGWKFIQWHMSQAGPLETFDANGNRVAK